MTIKKRPTKPGYYPNSDKFNYEPMRSEFENKITREHNQRRSEGEITRDKLCAREQGSGDYVDQFVKAAWFGWCLAVKEANQARIKGLRRRFYQETGMSPVLTGRLTNQQKLEWQGGIRAGAIQVIADSVGTGKTLVGQSEG